MPPSWHFDWGTFWLLAGLTMAEGFRRVPAGSLLLRHVPGYPWQVAAGPAPASRWRLASAFSPLALHCLVPPSAEGEGQNAGRLRRGWITLLRIPSLLALAVLLAGVPLLTASMGTTGLIVSIATLFAASLLTAGAAMAALVRMGVGWKTAGADALRIVSPFTAPRAPEIVLERVLSGVPPAEAARALLPPAHFSAWIRPFAYDQVTGSADAILPQDEARRIIRQPPPDASAGDAYCPRCAGVYVPGVERCHACDVPLERVKADEPAPPEPLVASG